MAVQLEPCPLVGRAISKNCRSGEAVIFQSSGQAKIVHARDEVDTVRRRNNTQQPIIRYIEDDIQSILLTPNLMMFDQPVLIPKIKEIDDDGKQDLQKRYKDLEACKDRIWKR